MTWFAHLRNQRVTGQGQAVACCSSGQINGLRGRRSNMNKPEEKPRNDT